MTLFSDFLDGRHCSRLTPFIQETVKSGSELRVVLELWLPCYPLSACQPSPCYIHTHGAHTHEYMCAHARAHTHKHTFCSLSSSSSPEHNICSIIIITKIYYLSDPELTFYKKDSISPFQPHYKYNYYYLHFREENAFMYLSLICFSY